MKDYLEVKIMADAPKKKVLTAEEKAARFEAAKKMTSELVDKSEIALKEFSTYTQAQVDKIVAAMALAGSENSLLLAHEAHDETGRGVVEDKDTKNRFASESVYNAIKNDKTVGVISEDRVTGKVELAAPLGILAGIVPTTNPTSTTIFKSMLAAKTRNTIVFAFHPQAQKSSAHAAKIVYDAAVAAGAPKNFIQWIDTPSLDGTTTLIQNPKIASILATGGPSMVNAALKSGNPSMGVGAGNGAVFVDGTANVDRAVEDLLLSKRFDNGMICASEQSVVVLDGVYEEVRAEFVRRGCHILTEEEARKVRETILVNGALNAKIVGQPAARIAAMAGVEVPESTKILIGEVESTDLSEAFAHEKLSPVLAMYRAADFEDALNKADTLVRDGGFGHTASIYLDEVNHREKLDAFAHTMKACRILVNTPSSQGGIGDLYNFKLAPSLTLGCGSWGGNSVSENVGIKHLLNIKTVAIRRENMLWFRAPEKVYFKKGCLPVALAELKAHKKAFIVTDSFLYNNGYTKPIEQKLDEMGISHTTFYNVAPDPTLACAREGAAQMAAFQPDLILAIGGGSAMDAGKIMWVLYEHPEADFQDMAMRFCDIRKRVYTFPKMGVKAYFVAIPTSAGTGSEVTPFAVITDERSGVKYPLADYELLPKMSIVDADMMMNAPRGLTAASGIDAVTHALEAYASVMATDYTDGLALRSLKLIFENLPKAYDNGPKEPRARENMAHAACMAGMAFANAFLGVCHSMAHKLGAFHHLPHGIANALMIDEVLRFNAAEVPTKMGTFPQYDHPHTLARYAEVADYLKLGGNTDEEKLENLIRAIDALKERVGIKKTIRDYGIEEQDFLNRLDAMVEQAFDDQCTGANPRYPLMREIKQMYLNAYYGTSENV